LATSHAYVVEVISGTPNTVKWTFNDINLPDSGTSWLGSMGFVAYEIAPVSGLAIADSISNFADIYFDFNLPIRTNTTKNYFFDCDSLANFELLTDSLCLGEAVEAVQNGFGATQLYWELAGALLDSVPLLNQPVNVNGTMALELTASNRFCTNVQHDSVYVLEVTAPIITANGNELVSDLSSNIQWFFDGVLIAGATKDTLLAQQNGWYKVRHIAPNGCVVFSDSVEVTGVGLDELRSNASIWFYPNPTNGMLYFSSSEKWTGQMQLRVYSFTGQLLSEQDIVAEHPGKELKVDLRTLQTGTYIVVLDSEGKETFRQVVVIANEQ
jgi:hypothetical protein